MQTVIKKRSLAEEVAGHLQGQIASGQYKVGDKLPIEPALMKFYGVGRSSIREAIKTLVNRGLLTVQQGVGTFVDSQMPVSEPLGQRLKRADIRDLDEVRKLLELKIAEKAAENYSFADIEKMRAFLVTRKKAALAGDLIACVKADIAFHVTIAQASGNEILLDLYKAVAVHMETWFLKKYTDTRSFIETQSLHEQLLKYIKNRDAKAAWDMGVTIIDHN